jgi:hypothetical protein
MTKNLPPDIVEGLKKPFQQVLSIGNFGDIVNDIAEEISEGRLTSAKLIEILAEHRTDLNKIKDQLLNMLLSYIELVVKDNVISDFESRSVRFLKMFFRVNEGDFYSKKYLSVEDILTRQFEYMYLNNRIDSSEALHKVELQSLFDLSYDQFVELSRRTVLKAIERGADVSELDTFLISD